MVVDHSEYALYRIDLELRSAFDDLVFTSILGDICDPATVETVVGRFQPEVLFHAAAYKHLPILQNQVREAVRNNVTGTMRLVEAADRHGVGTFVLISTDKAVNPANVMGATKRVAEMYCQGMNERSDTRFVTVRFGNVLGSSGSVVPLFLEQIEQGGPVTVTHPEVTRYFMTIPEAAQLVLQAASMARGGDVFLLDMGTPIKILDLAKRMIRLKGFRPKTDETPDGDIAIEITGLKPGEKLYEELLMGEAAAGTDHRKIMRAEEDFVSWAELRGALNTLEQACDDYDFGAIKAFIENLVEGADLSAQLVDLTTTAEVLPFRPGER